MSCVCFDAVQRYGTQVPGPTWTKQKCCHLYPKAEEKRCLQPRRKHEDPFGPQKGLFGSKRALSGPKAPSGLGGGAGALDSGGDPGGRSQPPRERTKPAPLAGERGARRRRPARSPRPRGGGLRGRQPFHEGILHPLVSSMVYLPSSIHSMVSSLVHVDPRHGVQHGILWGVRHGIPWSALLRCGNL